MSDLGSLGLIFLRKSIEINTRSVRERSGLSGVDFLKKMIIPATSPNMSVAFYLRFPVGLESSTRSGLLWAAHRCSWLLLATPGCSWLLPAAPGLAGCENVDFHIKN